MPPLPPRSRIKIAFWNADAMKGFSSVIILPVLGILALLLLH